MLLKLNIFLARSQVEMVLKNKGTFNDHSAHLSGS